MVEPAEEPSEHRPDANDGDAIELAESEDSIIGSDAIDLQIPAGSSEREFEDV